LPDCSISSRLGPEPGSRWLQPVNANNKPTASKERRGNTRQSIVNKVKIYCKTPQLHVQASPVI
jgi:hypothetical protein